MLRAGFLRDALGEETMAVQDAFADEVDAGRVSGKNLWSKAEPGLHPLRFASSGNRARRVDLQSHSGKACMRGPSAERRRFCRHAQRLPLIMSVFNQGALFQAQMVNCSEEGLCAEACQRILPGTSLHLRIDASEAGTLQQAVFSELRTTAVGEVKWCRSIEEESSPCYRFGIRYYSYC